MATVNKDFKVKHGLIVEGSSGTINGSNILTEASTEFLQDTAAGILTGGSHSGISFSYNDTTGVVDATVSANPTFQQSITFEGATADDYETVLEVTDPTADRTITLPNATGTVVLKDTTDTLTNKSISLTTNTVTGTIAEFNTALTDADFATLAGSETLTNKSMSGSSNTFTNIPNNALSNSAITINGTSVSLGGTRTLGTDDVSEGTTNKYFTDERAQDAAATMITNGSHTNITVTYDDNAGTLSLNATGGVASLTGTANEVEVTNVGTAYTVGLPNDVTITGNLTLSTEGTQASHAVTKAYVDSVTEGLHIHPSAVAATTGNIDLSTDLENGDVLDGVTLATGNRVLVKNQTNAAQNGIYVVQASGAAVRATDFDAPAEVDGGDFVFVTGGTVNDNTGWVQTSTGIVTIGTDPIVFTQFSGAGTYLAGNGLTLTGNTFAIDTGVTVDLATTQTLTNKTLTSPKVSGLYLSDNNVVVEGTDNTHETTLTFTDPTQDNTITFKDATGTVAFTSDIPTTTDGVSEGSSNLYFTDERAQDAVAAAIAAGTHSNITITYDDATNKFTFAAENGVADSNTDQLAEGTTNLYFTNERAEDAVGGMVTGNTETGISVTYDDTSGKLNFAVDDQFPSKSTTNLAEGTNLYFTDARAVSALQAVTPDFPAVEIADVAKQVAATASVSTASTATAVSWAKDTYRAAEFLVKIAQGSHTEVSKIILTMDSSDNIAITEYAMVGTNGDLGSVSADIDSSNARLRVTTLNNNSTVTVVGTLLK
jgi:hypothetical protein